MGMTVDYTNFTDEALAQSVVSSTKNLQNLLLGQTRHRLSR